MRPPPSGTASKEVIYMEENREKTYLNLVEETDLLSRGRKNSTVISVRVNTRLLELVDEKLRELNKLGVRITRADLINMLLLAFLRAEVNMNALPIQVNAIVNIYNIQKRVNTTPHHTTPHTNNNKYSEVRGLLNKAKVLKQALSHTKDPRKQSLLYSKLEELTGQVLEKLAGDDSSSAQRYRREALFILKGIQGLLNSDEH